MWKIIRHKSKIQEEQSEVIDFLENASPMSPEKVASSSSPFKRPKPLPSLIEYPGALECQSVTIFDQEQEEAAYI